MSSGGHNWKGSGTVDGTRSLSVMKLAHAGLLDGRQLSGWQWTSQGEMTASIQIEGGRDAVTLQDPDPVIWRGLAARHSTRADTLD